jgi:vitamin B12 transporter
MKFSLLLVATFLINTAVVAQEAGTVSGLVMVNDQPVADASVILTGPDGRTLTIQVDASGKFEFSGLKPGTYHIWASQGSFRTGREIKLASGQQLTIDLDLVLDARRIYPGAIRELVTIAADAAQPVEEISKTVNIISGQEMRDRADITLVDSLRTIPGFRIQQLGGFGRTASIKSRGLRNQDTAILIDGVRLRDSASITGDATAFLSDLTLTSVSKVEVLRGPGSSLYGTNAVGGTIDLQTPVPQSGWHGQVSGALGGLGLGRFRGNVSNGTDDGKFGLNAAAARTVFTKGIDGDDDARNTNFQSRLEFRPFSRTNISARFFVSDAFVALNSSPDTAGNPPASNSGIIDAVPGVNFVFDANDPDFSQKSRFFNGQVVLTQVINSVLSLQAYYSGLTTRRRNDNGLLGVPFQSESTSIFEGTIHTANAHLDWLANSANRFTAGYEFEHEDFRNEGFTPTGTEDFFTEATQSSSTIYFQDLVRLLDGRLQFAGGFRAQYYSLGKPGLSVNNPLYSDVTLEGVPAAYTFDGSASYFISRTGTKFRTHAGNGYRVPSLFERFGSFFNSFASPAQFEALGDPFLKPEKTAAFDAGVDQYLFGRKASVSAVYFYTKLTDIVGFGNSVPPIGVTPRPFGGYENQKGGVARGVEISGEVKPTSSTVIYASYTFTNSDQLTPQVTGSGVYKTLGIPDHQFTFNATQRIKGFWVNADFLCTSSYLAPIFSNASFNSYVYRFEGNRRLDLTAGYTFTFDTGKLSVRLFGTVENLFDNEYFENGFRTPGRAGRAGLSFAF